jgi:hypothetical protein
MLLQTGFNRMSMGCRNNTWRHGQVHDKIQLRYEKWAESGDVHGQQKLQRVTYNSSQQQVNDKLFLSFLKDEELSKTVY